MVGHWRESPVGAMCDVMWALPDGERALLVGSPRDGQFITAVYEFDRVEHVPMSCHWDKSAMRVRAGDLELGMRTGRARKIPLARLRSLPAVRWLEAPVAHRLLGVRTFGTGPTGVFEWYRADQYRPLVSAEGALAGLDLGSLTRFDRPTGFGFSEPPRRPAVVRVRPLLIDPRGNVERVLRGGGST